MPTVMVTSGLLTLSMTLIIAVATMGMALFTIVIPNELRGLCMAVLTAAILLFALAVAPLAVSVLSDFLGGMTTISRALSIVCVAAAVLAATAFALASNFLAPVLEQSE